MSERTEALTEQAAPLVPRDGSYVDWSAIFAGAVVASAVAFVFSSFGAALGLSLVSPAEADGGNATFNIIAVGLWMLWTTVSSFMAGSYLTGRMRRRVDSASADEVGVRDGCHGLAVWGVGVIIGAVMLSSAVGTATRTAETVVSSAAEATGSVVSGVASAAGSVAGGAAEMAAAAGDDLASQLPADLRANPLDYATDALLRPDLSTAQPSDGTSTAAFDAAPTTRTQDPERLRREVRTILASIISNGELEEQDREYLATLVARNSSLDRAAAEERVDSAIERVKTAREQAIETANELQSKAEANAEQAAETAKEAVTAARQYGVLSAFVLAAALLIAGAASYWAASVGGLHRDEGRVFSAFRRWA